MIVLKVLAAAAFGVAVGFGIAHLLAQPCQPGQGGTHLGGVIWLAGCPPERRPGVLQ